MDYELYHYGVKGMKWGIRRTQEQLGRRASQKHRDSLSRYKYAKARVSSSKERLERKYSRKLDKETKRYTKSNKDERSKDRLSVSKEQYRARMANLGKNSKINAGTREFASWSVKSLAKSTLVPVGAAAAAAALTVIAPETIPVSASAYLSLGGPAAVIPAAVGASKFGAGAAMASNIYRGYQAVRNVMEISNVPESRHRG